MGDIDRVARTSVVGIHTWPLTLIELALVTQWVCNSIRLSSCRGGIPTAGDRCVTASRMSISLEYNTGRNLPAALQRAQRRHTVTSQHGSARLTTPPKQQAAHLCLEMSRRTLVDLTRPGPRSSCNTARRLPAVCRGQ